MAKIRIDDQEYEVPAGITVLQAARLVGIEIPVFCYHDRLAVAGNCRMCLVEMENSPKPVASCAMPVSDGMSIRTRSEKVAKSRKGVLEFLLVNHPLDCPVCDQAGECDLQDITMAYGPSTSRFEENKRAVADKNLGPLIRTTMTRCIHCTRCVRFASSVAGVPEIGVINRGENAEILSWLDRSVSSELSGNLVDICPVGALTSKPYAFRGRPWELSKTESIDVMDAVGSAIRIDTNNMQVMRILPRLNEDINEEWISDKSRFACDGLLTQRLDRPWIRNEKGHLEPASWNQAFQAIAQRLRGVPGNRMGAIAGDMVDVEAMTALKDLLNSMGCDNLECRQDGAFLDYRSRSSYIFNTTIAGIEQADFCLLLGANLRRDAPILAARLRKRFNQAGVEVAWLGGNMAVHQRLTHPVLDLGDDPLVLDRILDGTHSVVSRIRNAKNPMLILGLDMLARPDGDRILHRSQEIALMFRMVRDDWNGFNVLQKCAARVGGLDIGFCPTDPERNIGNLLEEASSGQIEVIYLLGADEIDTASLKNTFVIYQGHHGDRGAQIADVILPGAAYTEKNATWVNLEGRPQQSRRAIAPPGDAREDWKIIRALSEVLGKKLPFDTVEQLRMRMIHVNPVFGQMDEVIPSFWKKAGNPGELDHTPFAAMPVQFYMTDSISRHSVTMAQCTEEIESPLCRKDNIA